MRSLHDSKTTVTLLASLSLVGALAGCSTSTNTAGTDEAPSTKAPSTTAPSTAAPSTEGSSSSTYKDGTYTEDGSYQSPGGAESIEVTVTLANDLVTDVKVVGNGESQDAKHYQGQFIGGISAEVVGKDIDSLKVSKVAGSSLTSGGFNEAIDAIKADAAA